MSAGGCSSRSPGSCFSLSVEMQRARDVMLRLWLWLRGAVVALEGCVGQCWGDRAARAGAWPAPGIQALAAPC